jgi:site-specific DNA-methyltransferase (adenine-specific)
MVELINGDCMDYMATLKDNAFELAIVDPPYGIGNFTPETDSGSYKKGTKKLKTHYDQNYNWNNEIPPNEYFNELIRVSARQIIWGANYYNRFSSFGGALVWYKNQGLTSQLSQCEIASLSWKKQVDYVHIEKLNGFLAPIQYIHPCEKPIKLYEWLLKNYAKEGDKILDTHLGSGSSAIAAYNYKFDFVGIELDEEYFKAASERFEQHKKQLVLW